MSVTAEVPALLALDAGVREIGWAVFENGEVIKSRATGLSTRRKVEPEVPISHLIESLNVLASQWQPQIVALRQTQRHQLAGSGVRPAGVFAG